MSYLSSLAGLVLSLDAAYALTGLTLAVFAAMTFADRSDARRIGSGLFWLILGAIFAFGSILPHWLTGVLVLLLVGLDGVGLVRRPAASPPAEAEQKEREADARRLGNRLFLPILTIPAVTFLFLGAFQALGLDAGQGALVGLGYGGVAAMLAGLRLTGGTTGTMMAEGRRLNETMGPDSILPQLLTSVGLILTTAGVGKWLTEGVLRFVAADNLFLLVVVNCLIMTLFTVLLGNAFGSFAVVAGGVLAPLIIQRFGADPALAAILTLTAGSSGTLMTPMAANFNTIPATLLGMGAPGEPGRAGIHWGIIKFQLPYALSIWTLHVLLLWLMIEAINLIKVMG